MAEAHVNCQEERVRFDPLLMLCAGLSGLLGVLFSAAGRHMADEGLGIAGTILLVHAPALLALGLRDGERRLAPSAVPIVLIVGLVLFCGDLASRAFLGDRLFPFAAPGGGMALIAGWAGLALAGLFWRGRG